MKELNLRPHHALCLLLFCAEGHSINYANKMRQLIKMIEAGKIQNIRMTKELDEICGYCTDNKNGLCSHSDEVLTSDAKILTACGLTAQQSISWAELRRRLIEDIVMQNALGYICQGCTYLNRCERKGANKTFAI